MTSSSRTESKHRSHDRRPAPCSPIRTKHLGGTSVHGRRINVWTTQYVCPFSHRGRSGYRDPVFRQQDNFMHYLQNSWKPPAHNLFTTPQFLIRALYPSSCNQLHYTTCLLDFDFCFPRHISSFDDHGRLRKTSLS